MRNTKKSLWQTVDWVTILFFTLLVVAGWFSICGASYDFDNAGLFDPSGRPGSQLIWIGTSVVIIFVIMMLDDNFYDIFANLIYALVIAMLLLTIVGAITNMPFVPDIKGSRSWLVFGPIRLQPAEFAKFGTALALAKFMNSYGFKLNTPGNFLKSLLIIFLPMVCILMQKETGSALVYFAFFLVLYREGMSGYFLLAGICAVLYFVTAMKYSGEMVGITPLDDLLVTIMILVITTILIGMACKDKRNVLIVSGSIAFAFLAAYITSLYIPVNFTWISYGLLGALIFYLIFLSLKKWVWPYALIALFAIASVGFLYSVDYVFDNVLEPHHQGRIKVLLGLEDDPSGVGYNVNQSKIAIGSGGLTGKGFLNGTQTKLKYVPEQDTDFIFCTVGEEQGFLVASAVLILFGLFILRLVWLAERQQSTFARVYGYSVASIFFFHLIINIGMVVGITPVIGIPLPFFSYGGSSLWGFTILLFIFLRLDASRKVKH
ncbi:rod shape-determining protein RodA [Parabacteroides sp. OttesenSCG-928-G06]|nr:rod shape-determining protein RodA [Parabacteroides sp. OttesenSCG-928-G06]